MIYYIVKIEANGDESVVSSHDSADNASRFLNGLMSNDMVLAGDSWEAPFTYRIDTVPSNEEKRERNKQIPADPHKLLAGRRAGKNTRIVELKMKLNDAYGKRAEDFSVSELFGNDPASKLESKGAVCVECGALVSDLFTHTAWHNKLLP